MQRNQSPRKGASSFQGPKIECRSWQGEFRATDEEGVIEGYVTKWGTVDSYNSTFERGCFAKTLKERGLRVRVFWNHNEDELIGKPLELREDDVGLFARLKLVLTVRRAQETFDLVKAEALDCFSFGFRTIKDAWIDGVRHIKEVALYEVSPVVFEANSAAQITGVRNMPHTHKPGEVRAEVFADTVHHAEMCRRHSLLSYALDDTLMDIWWGNDLAANADEVRAKIGDCLEAFAGEYMAYVDELLAMHSGEMRSHLPAMNPLAATMRQHLSTAGTSPEQLAATTSLTVAEVRALKRGDATVPAEKLADLPEEIRKAAGRRRAEQIEALCSELRSGGLDDAERARLLNLINPHSETRGAAVEGMGDVLERINEFRASLQTT